MVRGCDWPSAAPGQTLAVRCFVTFRGHCELLSLVFAYCLRLTNFEKEASTKTNDSRSNAASQRMLLRVNENKILTAVQRIAAGGLIVAWMRLGYGSSRDRRVTPLGGLPQRRWSSQISVAARQHTAASRSQQLAWSTPDSAPPVRRELLELLPLVATVCTSPIQYYSKQDGEEPGYVHRLDAEW